MRSLVVVVPHVLVEDSLKVAPTPDEQPVQAFLSDRPHPALGVGVRIRRRDRGLDDLGAVGDKHVVEGAGELGVAVMDEELRHAAPRPLGLRLHRQLPCPLHHPGPARVVGDAAEPNPSRPKLDEEQDVEVLRRTVST
jgi:hypothetical protein